MTRFTTTRNNPLSRVVSSLAAALFWLAVWQAISMAVAQELLVPAPSVVFTTLARLIRTADFWRTTGASLLRVAAGFAAGVAGGCLAAALTTRFRAASLLLSPLLRIVRAAPVASFIILALVWLPVGRLPAFISFLMVLPVVWDSMAEGIRRQDTALLEMARVFRMGRRRTMRQVRLPMLAPFFAAACANGMGLAWKSGVAAEVICRPPLSIGREMQDAKVYLETPEVFAWTITVVALSMLLERLLRMGTARWSGQQAPGKAAPARPAGNDGKEENHADGAGGGAV